MSDNVAKQMKGVERKQPSRRRHLRLARADIVRHTSGIVIAWFDNVRLRRGAKIKSKQRQRTTVRKSLRMPIVLGSALKSSRKNIPILILKNREISLSCGPSTWKLCNPVQLWLVALGVILGLRMSIIRSSRHIAMYATAIYHNVRLLHAAFLRNLVSAVHLRDDINSERFIWRT